MSTVATATLGRVRQRDALTRHDTPLIAETRTDVSWSHDDSLALDAIIDERPQVGVFMSRAWLSGLIAAPPADFDPVVLSFREGRVLRGIAPLAIRHARSGTRVALLGGGYRSDRVDVLAARGYETVVADLLLEWLDESMGVSGYVLELRDVPSDSVLWAAIRRAIDERQRSFVLVPSEVHPVPYLLLDELHHAGSPGERAEKADSVARHRAQLERRGRITAEILQGRDAVLGALNTLEQLLRARWGAGMSVLEDPQTMQFHRHVLPLLLDEGRLQMLQMRADERPIAVCYMLSAGSERSAGGSGRWFGYLLSGYDREWAGRIHLGRLALVAAIDLAERGGAREFDFLKGSERYKYFWPVRERTTIDANLYSGTSRTHISRATHEGRQVAASLVKFVRGLFPSQS
jgi:CelD/BcsL family acetyltransferase involved in cellulose biosynthesis